MYTEIFIFSVQLGNAKCIVKLHVKKYVRCPVPKTGNGLQFTFQVKKNEEMIKY